MPMKFYGFYIIGVLVLIPIAQSFVLMTANIEDVGRLAKKFVSDTIFEKISDFIGTEDTHVVNYVNDKKYMNDDFIQKPNKATIIPKWEDKNYKISRQKEKQPNTNSEFKKWINAHNAIKEKMKSVKTKPRYMKVTQNYYNDEKYRNNPDYNDYQSSKKTPQNHLDNQNSYESSDSEHDNKQKLNPKKYKTTKFQSEKPLKNSGSIYRQNKDQNHSNIKGHKSIKEESGEDSITSFLKEFEFIFESENKTDNIEKHLPKADISAETKESKEFEQYDTKNQRKPESVATGGPVSLPDISTEESWW